MVQKVHHKNLYYAMHTEAMNVVALNLDLDMLRLLTSGLDLKIRELKFEGHGWNSVRSGTSGTVLRFGCRFGKVGEKVLY